MVVFWPRVMTVGLAFIWTSGGNAAKARHRINPPTTAKISPKVVSCLPEKRTFLKEAPLRSVVLFLSDGLLSAIKVSLANT
jgi:hypothetical protein